MEAQVDLTKKELFTSRFVRAAGVILTSQLSQIQEQFLLQIIAQIVIMECLNLILVFQWLWLISMRLGWVVIQLFLFRI